MKKASKGLFESLPFIGQSPPLAVNVPLNVDPPSSPEKATTINVDPPKTRKAILTDPNASWRRDPVEGTSQIFKLFVSLKAAGVNPPKWDEFKEAPEFKGMTKGQLSTMIEEALALGKTRKVDEAKTVQTLVVKAHALAMKAPDENGLAACLWTSSGHLTAVFKTLNANVIEAPGRGSEITVREALALNSSKRPAFYSELASSLSGLGFKAVSIKRPV